MKRKIMKFIAAVAVMAGIGNAYQVMAAETLTAPVRIGSFAYFDMDGDGSNEKIGIFPDTSNGPKLAGYTLRVNDTHVLDTKIGEKKECIGIDALMVDTDTSDQFTDLYISQFNETGYFDGNVYRYDGKTLKKLYSVKNAMKLSVNASPSHEQPGNGKIRFTVPGYPVGKNTKLGEYEIYMDFAISKGSVKCSDTVFRTTANYQSTKTLEAYKAFKVYKDKSLKKKAYSVKAGEKFYVTKIVVSKGKIKYLAIKNGSGKTGWIAAPTKKFVK